jgi:hypothetical protein
MGPSQLRDDASPIEDTIEGQDNDMTNELTVPEQWIDDHSQDADRSGLLRDLQQINQPLWMYSLC